MIMNPLKLRISMAAVSEEADELEARFGSTGALRHVRDRIASAKRGARQRLYRVHDEIVRRHPAASPA